MIIRGGRIFVMEDTLMPKVTITESSVVMECADSSIESMNAFICARVGDGSVITGCNFMTMEQWAKQRAKESIDKAKSDLQLKQAPVMQRIRKFLRLGAAS